MAVFGQPIVSNVNWFGAAFPWGDALYGEVPLPPEG